MVKASTISAKYSGGPKRNATSTSIGASSMRRAVPTVPATNDPIAAVVKRRAAASLARHLHAVDRGHGRGRIARRVDQNRRRRSAVHRAVVDAAEHDECRRRLEAERRRQQQRDGDGRADARQHSDRGAEHHADEAEEQVHWCQRDRESLGEMRGQVRHSGAATRLGQCDAE